MLKISRVVWKNLLLSGNHPIELDVADTRQTLLMGKNGRGKSTFVVALTYGLYGKPLRDINKPALINNINDRELVVEVHFERDGHHVKVTRGMKPSVFEIEVDHVVKQVGSSADELQTYLEQHWLKIDFKTFCQVVVLGAGSYVPFMKLTAANRRALVEDLLDIQIFSTMQSLGKERLNQSRQHGELLQRQYDDVSRQITLAQSFLAQQQQAQDERHAQIRAQQDEIRAKQIALRAQHETLKLTQQVRAEALDALRKRAAKLAEFRSAATTAEKQIAQLQKRIDYYRDTETCSQCQQTITEDFKASSITALNQRLQQFKESADKLATKITSFGTIDAEILAAEREHRAGELETTKLLTEIGSCEHQISSLQVLLKVPTTNAPTVDIAQLEAEQLTLEQARDDNARERQLYEHATTMLKDDGIKSSVIRHYLPIINTNLNRYLLSLDFPVQFSFNELFEERVGGANRDKFTYGSFSDGQKKRIDLALLWTWRAVARHKHSAATNLLVLDEICDSSLDHEGMDDVFKVLNTLEADTNIIVISPKGDVLMDRFGRVYEFSLNRGFSEMTRRV
jgi:DNA repair exonuclease SbcCD ATPase subunit